MLVKVKAWPLAPNKCSDLWNPRMSSFTANLPSIDTRCLTYTHLLMCICCSVHTHLLMGTGCSMHSCRLLHTCSIRHAHLPLSTHPFVDTFLIVPLLWLTHFIQAILVWAVSLHESKLLWLTCFFRATLIWYSILVSQCTPYSCCTQFFDLCTAALLFLPFSFPVLSGASAHPPLPLFYASCMPSATSSALHLSWVSRAT